MRSLIGGSGSRKALALSLALLLILLVAVPLGMLLYGSIRTAPPGAPGELTLANYAELFHAPWIASTMLNTLAVSLLATGIGLAIGIPMAWFVGRAHIPHPRVWELLCTAPLFLSPLLGAVAWSLLGSPKVGMVSFLTFGLFQPNWDLQGFWGTSLIMGIYYSTYVYLYMWSAFRNVDPAIEEAASLAGLGPLSTAVRITLPAIMPTVVLVSILVFVLATGLFSVPAVLGWPSGFFVLSTRVYFLLSFPPVNYGLGTALAVVFLLITLIGVTIHLRLVRRTGYAQVSGKSAGLQRVQVGRWGWIGMSLISLYTCLTTVLPCIVLVVISVIPYPGNYTRAGFGEYTRLLHNDMFWRALRNSVTVGVTGATIAIALSVLIAYSIYRLGMRWTAILDYLVSLPIGIPGVVLGAGLLWTWLSFPFHRLVYGTLAIIVIASVTQFLTTGVRSVSAVLVQIGRDMEESAWVGGVSWTTTLRRILLPLLTPGVQSGWILLFVLCFRELSAVILLWSSSTITLPVMSFEVWREGSYARLGTLGLAESVVTGLVVILALFVGARLTRRPHSTPIQERNTHAD